MRENVTVMQLCLSPDIVADPAVCRDGSIKVLARGSCLLDTTLHERLVQSIRKMI